MLRHDSGLSCGLCCLTLHGRDPGKHGTVCNEPIYVCIYICIHILVHCIHNMLCIYSSHRERDAFAAHIVPPLAIALFGKLRD